MTPRQHATMNKGHKLDILSQWSGDINIGAILRSFTWGRQEIQHPPIHPAHHLQFRNNILHSNTQTKIGYLVSQGKENAKSLSLQKLTGALVEEANSYYTYKWPQKGSLPLVFHQTKKQQIQPPRKRKLGVLIFLFPSRFKKSSKTNKVSWKGHEIPLISRKIADSYNKSDTTT